MRDHKLIRETLMGLITKILPFIPEIHAVYIANSGKNRPLVRMLFVSSPVWYEVPSIKRDPSRVWQTFVINIGSKSSLFRTISRLFCNGLSSISGRTGSESGVELRFLPFSSQHNTIPLPPSGPEPDTVIGDSGANNHIF